MGFSAKFSSNNEGWGMGFLLILFPDDNNNNNNNHNNSPFSKKKPLSLFSLSSSKSSNNLLFSKTQFTLSICCILLFTTLLLFTLSSFEPTSVLHHNVQYHSPRRLLLKQTKIPRNTHQRFLSSTLLSHKLKGSESNFNYIPALQGMGSLFLRGTKKMTDLIVGHVNEETTEIELRTFLRAIFNSGVLSKCDFVLIFPSPFLATTKFGAVVNSECDSFLRLVQLGGELGKFSESGSSLNRYLKEVVNEGEKDPIWGKKKGNSTESTRSSYGSIVGFDSSELDPEDTLSGFLDHVPMSLRRWAGYPMLLGRVRRQFKHMMLIDVKNTLILSDPFSRVRNRSSESLFLWSNPLTESITQHHINKRHDIIMDPKTRFYPGIIVGGSRGVRRFATSALTEIVRNVIEHKGKGKGRNSVKVTESGLVNQLVDSGHLLRNINLVTPTESITELVSSSSLNSGLRVLNNYNVVQRSSGVSVVDINNAIMREICASNRLYSSVYNDCINKSINSKKY